MTRIKACLFLSLLFVLVTTNPASAQEKPRRIKVYGIAFQAGSLLELKDIIEKEKWAVTIFPRWADKIIVALRTDHVSLLYNSYSHWTELEEDVRENNNKDGKIHMIYFYNVEDDGGVTLEKYSQHQAD